MRHLKFVIDCVLVVSSAVGAVAQESARTVQYHAQDIVAIHAKVKYTTLIELPTTEKILEAATGDKDFWIVDVVGNFCFVHPAKQGISSNLNPITDKGNIYSFTLQDISSLSTTPDLKVIVVPADLSAIVAASGPAEFVPAAQLEQSRQQLALLQSHVEQAVDEFKSACPTQLKFDYVYKANEAPFKYPVDLSRRQIHVYQDECAGEVQLVRNERRQAQPRHLRPVREYGVMRESLRD